MNRSGHRIVICFFIGLPTTAALLAWLLPYLGKMHPILGLLILPILLFGPMLLIWKATKVN